MTNAASAYSTMNASYSSSSGRQGISFDQVAAAAEAMVREGQRPTLRGIRAQTGGSLGTVQKHFDIWKQKHAPHVETTLSLPPEIQRVIILEIEKRAGETTAMIDQELKDARIARDQLAEEGELQGERIKELSDEIEHLKANLQFSNGTIESLRAELEQARADTITSRIDAERLVMEARREAESARVDTESVRTELARAQLRLEQLPTLDADNRELRKMLDAEVVARTTAEKDAAVAEAVSDELKGFRQRATDLQQKLDTEHDLRLGAEKTASSLQAELDTERKLREQYTPKAKPAGDLPKPGSESPNRKG